MSRTLVVGFLSRELVLASTGLGDFEGLGELEVRERGLETRRLAARRAGGGEGLARSTRELRRVLRGAEERRETT